MILSAGTFVSLDPNYNLLTPAFVQGKSQGDKDKDKLNALRNGLSEHHFTAVELTNYRKDGKPFQVCVP